MTHRVEPGLPAGGGKATGEHPGGAFLFPCRAGPEQALVLRDLPVAHPRVVGRAAGAGPPQLVEHGLGIGEGEEAFLAQAGGQGLDDFQVGPHVPGRGEGGPPQDHPPFQVGHGAVLLGPLGGGEDDVRELGGLGQEVVRHHQEVQVLQPPLHQPGIGRGNHYVGAHDHQAADAACVFPSGAARRGIPTGPLGPQGVQQLEGRLAGPGEFVFIHAPDRGHVAAGGGIGYQAVTRQLVGLLPVFAAPLAVPLAGKAPPAGVGLAHQSQRQRQVDEGKRVVDPLGLLLGAPAGQYHGGGRPSQHEGGLQELALGDPGDAFHPFGPVGGRDAPHPLEPLGAGFDVIGVDKPPPDEDVEQPVGQGGVGAGSYPQVEGRAFGGGRPPGIGNYQVAAVLPLGLEILHHRRHRCGRIAPHQEDGLRVGNVLQGEGQAPVHAQRPNPGRRCGGHTEAAVVIDVGRAQGHPGELAQQVGLFVGQGAAAEDTHGVFPVGGLGGLKRLGNGGEGLIPGGGGQLPGGVADQRGEQPVGMAQGFRRGPALDAKGSLVDRKLVVGGDRRPIPGAAELHSALEGAVGAVGQGFESCRAGLHSPVPTIPFRLIPD